MKIAFPVNQDNGLESEIAMHFGRASAFIIYDSESKQTVTLPIIKHEEHKCLPVHALTEFNLDAIFVFGLGWRALKKLEENKIQAKTGPFKTIKQAVANLDKLEDLANPCGGK